MFLQSVPVKKILWLILLTGVILMGIKFYAWFITGSNGIFTDALESIVNVVTGFLAIFSAWYAARPSDANHPYGHGKMEFLSAGFEGMLILVASGSIIYKAVNGLFHPYEISNLDLGLGLTVFCGMVNGIAGIFLVKKGRQKHSMILVGNGTHLLSDMYTSLGLVAGLAVVYFTGYNYLDSVVALVFGLVILYSGYRITRESVAGLLDETDEEKVDHLVAVLEANRRPMWIDIHNLRIQKFGGRLHIDCHLTLPWYLNLTEAHTEMKALEEIVKKALENEVELNVHADPCEFRSCNICKDEKCEKRNSPFVRTVKWNSENILRDRRHDLQE